MCSTIKHKYDVSLTLLLCLHRPIGAAKVLKAIASLVVIVVTSATIIWFLKTCLLVQ